MIVVKNKRAIEKMRTAGQALARIMADVEPLVVPGANTAEIDAFVEKRMREAGLVPACKGYMGYRHATCISVNDIVVHGIPSEQVVLADGDCVTVDMVGSYKGYHADMARNFIVGNGDEVVQRLVAVAQQSLDAGLAQVKPGVRLGVVQATIQKVVEDAGFGVLRDFVGHGIGKSMHEDPQVPNFGKTTEGPVLQVGMTLAIEPMITEKNYAVTVLSDGWSVQTNDGGRSAHVEDTIVVTHDGVEVLTRLSTTEKGEK